MIPRACGSTFASSIPIRPRFLLMLRYSVIPVGGVVHPPVFSIHTGAGFITVYQPESGHFQPDFFVGSFQGIRTACYHVVDCTGCKRDIKHTGKDFVCAIDADSTHRIKSHNHCLKIFTILHSGLYISRKMTGSGAALQIIIWKIRAFRPVPQPSTVAPTVNICNYPQTNNHGQNHS